MKLSGVEVFHGKKYTRPTTNRNLLFLVTLTLIIFPLLLFLLKFPTNPPPSAAVVPPLHHRKCDLFKGEWVPHTEATFYNSTCPAIHDNQNCEKYGRPDSDFMKWKWKPDGCDLPTFDPYEFLEIVRHKSLAFVGDSLARNQMQSLICMLSKVEYPIDVSTTKEKNFQRWYYVSYNFTIAQFWSPYLVKAQESEPNGSSLVGLFSLYLDEFDEKWTIQIDEFDYLIINGGHWFRRPILYHLNRQIVGCSLCQMKNITDYPLTFGYRKAIRKTFRAISSRENFKGITILRTFAPMHFEGGDWKHLGDCTRKRPYTRNEISLEGLDLQLYMTQIEEFKAAMRNGRGNGLRFRLLDPTQAMLLRPDGHPSKYGHWPNEKVILYNDCVHWCLPGPIDMWNDLLLRLLKIEGRR